MKILSKFISVLCIMALLISAVPVHAQASPTLYFTNNTVTIGGSTAYCYLTMKNAENISAMDYRIFYDADNLEFSSISNTGFTSQGDVTVSVNSSEPGIIHVTLISQNGLNGSNYLNLMYFKAKAGAKPGVYPITVIVTDIFNTSLETVEAITQSGTMTVKEEIQTVKNASFYYVISSSNIKCGENFEYTLGGGSLNDLSAGTFTFFYDAEKLKPESVVPSSLLTVYDINNSHEGIIKLSFVSEKAIPSYNYLVTINFSSIGHGKANIDFESSDLYDYSYNVMSGNSLSKSVSIAEPEIVVDHPDLKIIPPENIFSDKEFEVQVQLEGGSGVRAGDFTVNYDDSVLECVGLNAGTISGAWIVTDKNFSGGKARFSLMSNVDIAEDSVLATLTLKSRENIDSKSNITISGSGVNDVKFNTVTLEYVGAEIKAIRPEYTVNFYDSDGVTLLLTQKVMSGNSTIAPDVVQIKKNDNTSHLKFSGWNKDYSIITDNTDIAAVYSKEVHTVITQSAVEATCTESGLTEGKYCVVCDTILVKQEVVPANGHKEVPTPDIAPGFDTEGYKGGTHCDSCGEVLTQPEIVPPTGVLMSAILNSDGILKVKGVLSDTVSTEGTTFLTVFNNVGQLLNTVDITMLNQSEFEIEIPNCSSANYIKILRWDMATLKPLCDAIICSVTKEYPILYARLEDTDILTISGALSDNPVSEGRTFISVYDKDERMLKVTETTEYNQSEFSISIENMKDAHVVKILRWEMSSLRPLHNAVEVRVKRE